MSLSIYDASIPWILHALSNLGGVLDKGSAHCEKEKIDPSAMLSARLYPDMFALTRQVQVAAFLKGLDQGKFQGADTRPIEIKFPNATLKFPSGWNYLMAFALPNLYFHSATAYDILRHNGVKLGKPDFLGAVGKG
jgi:hypothetical protein